LIDTLVALHGVEPASVGLADFGSGEGFLQRQVRRWRKQLDASWSREIPGIVELHRYLEAHIPSRSEVTIMHGDFRLDNVLVDTEAAHDPITGVLDWEMATLGDPLADVALMLAYSEAAARTGSGLVSDAPLAPGYLSGDQTLQRYAERSGRDLSVMNFHLALAYFKLAVILEGIHFRYTQGQTVGEGFEAIGSMVEPLVAAGLRAS